MSNITIKKILLYFLIFHSASVVAGENDITFNTDVLDVVDRNAVDLTKFSRAGYIMPGIYPMAIRIGKSTLAEQPIEFYAVDGDDSKTTACINNNIVEAVGFKKSALKDLTWVRHGQCLNMQSLKGITAKGDLAEGMLYINIPQAYLEYVDENWEPPARWDEGIPGVLFDYSFNVQRFNFHDDTDSTSLSGNGTIGVNSGPWRLRADWQGQYDKNEDIKSSDFAFSRFYAYRALKDWHAKLVLGEDYFRSDVFDSFRFIGVNIRSDDSMLPPSLRGYAPEVTGIAKTNAKVTISQQGRVIYETQVAMGPFRIQNLGDTVNGMLDVKIQEEDGSVSSYQVDTAYVPYLTRPGTVRYKFSAGRPMDMKHNVEGPMFSSAEATWGINNGWSLYGGAVGAENYGIAAVGVGRDLLALGAISLDVSQSRAIVYDEKRQGRSYRVNYSKTFDDYGSQISFAGYRFSEKEFLSMGQYLNLLRYDDIEGKSKELYTISFNQRLDNLQLSLFLNYNHQTYWDRMPDNTYSLSVSRYFSLGKFKNINLNFSAVKTRTGQEEDENTYFLNLSLPTGMRGNIGYDLQANHGSVTNNVSYYNALDDNNSYRVRVGLDDKNKVQASGYYQHDGDTASVTTSASYYSQNYSSLGLSLEGGMTATPRGTALHRINTPGDTRMLLDTDVADIPVRSEYGGVIYTNYFGKAISTDIQSYYRNSYRIDLENLPDNAEAVASVKQTTLTEGAIGYQSFNVLSGSKAMAVIRYADGSFPPFGAMVTNKKGIQVGMVSDNGEVWLSGLNPNESMNVQWGEGRKCEFTLPSTVSNSYDAKLLFLCK